MDKERQESIAQAALLAAAEAAGAKGVTREAFLTVMVECAMQLVTTAEGGLAGLAEWHRREYEGLKARIAGYN